MFLLKGKCPIFGINTNVEFSIHAAVCIEDDKKGEQIILFTNIKDLTRDKIAKTCKERQFSELYIPKVIITIKELPVLTTGKLDYHKLVELAQKETNKA